MLQAAAGRRQYGFACLCRALYINRPAYLRLGAPVCILVNDSSRIRARQLVISHLGRIRAPVGL